MKVAAKTDAEFMARAVALARRGVGHTRPNPPVGAVIVRDGEIIGEGWHKKAGGDHAEVAAIKGAMKFLSAGGKSGVPDKGALNGATIYVTLEPCSKAGRVGACTDAIAASGISKVVYAIPDPNPDNCGKAKRALARAGVQCERFKGDKDVVAEADELICHFRKHVLTGLPYVIVKIAMSVDGRICDNWGDAKWISSKSSRELTGGDLRGKVDAIMVGAETIRRDNPSLLSKGRPNPDLVRVVVSKSGRLPKAARVFSDGAPNRTIVFDDARKAIEELGRRGALSVLCEGGLKLARSLADAGLVDQWVNVFAPILIGSRPIAKAVRGKFNEERSFANGGDRFLTADFGAWATGFGD